MKTKLSVLCGFAALSIMVSGCATENQKMDVIRGGPTGNFADHSTRDGLDVAGGAFHKEVVQNDITTTNIGGYHSVDKSTDKKTSVSVPLVGPASRFLFGFGRCVLDNLAAGAEVSVCNSPVYTGQYAYASTYESQTCIYRQAQQTYGLGGSHGGSGCVGGYVSSSGTYYSPTILNGHGDHGGGSHH